jgi:HAD superfamily hydrolase (TIGR01549 family)
MDKLNKFKAKAIIFDKDGTLIDFDAMWGSWTLVIADRINALCNTPMREALCLAFGYDHTRRKVLADGKLAATPMWQLYNLTVEVVQSQGVDVETAKQLVEQAWVIPEPVELAKPFTDTRALFSRLYHQGIRIAIATTDDRDPTQAMIDAFDIGDYIETMVCSDDGIKAKPAPDMVLTICGRMGIKPSEVMVVGDTTADLKMARAANVGLVVGVLSGVSSARDLIPFADVLIESVDELQRYSFTHTASSSENSLNLTDLNPDIAI